MQMSQTHTVDYHPAYNTTHVALSDSTNHVLSQPQPILGLLIVASQTD